MNIGRVAVLNHHRYIHGSSTEWRQLPLGLPFIKNRYRTSLRQNGVPDPTPCLPQLLDLGDDDIKVLRPPPSVDQRRYRQAAGTPRARVARSRMPHTFRGEPPVNCAAASGVLFESLHILIREGFHVMAAH